MKIQLKDSQLVVFKNWIERQEYLNRTQKGVFKRSIRANGIEFNDIDLSMVTDLCPFGFITNRIESGNKIGVCQYCKNELCEAQAFNSICFKCGKKPY